MAKKKPEPEEQELMEEETAQQAGEEPSAQPAPDEASAPSDEERLAAELAAQKEQYLRVLAEYDNFRKRTANEKAGVYHSAVSDTVQAILPIADNIDRALEQENASAEDMRKGVEMIRAQIGAAFEKLGITPMGEVGESFDPNRHNAVAHIEDESLGENVIAAVYQKGYLLGDRVVRPAMVQVAN